VCGRVWVCKFVCGFVCGCVCTLSRAFVWCDICAVFRSVVLLLLCCAVRCCAVLSCIFVVLDSVVCVAVCVVIGLSLRCARGANMRTREQQQKHTQVLLFSFLKDYIIFPTMLTE